MIGQTLSMLDVHGSNPERISWEDGQGTPLENRAAEIAVELIATAEINYREACLRRHLWVMQKGRDLRARMDEERREAEATAGKVTRKICGIKCGARPHQPKMV